MQRLSAGLALALLSGCGVDAGGAGEVSGGGTPSELDRLEELTFALQSALPLDQISSRLSSWLGISNEELSALAPLGARALTQSTEDALMWEEQIRQGLIEPLEGLTAEVSAERFYELSLGDYDLLSVTEVGGWWLSHREVLSCALAYLITQLNDQALSA